MRRAGGRPRRASRAPAASPGVFHASPGGRRAARVSLRAMAARPLYVGIDLGTTNSTAAAFDGEKVTLVRNSQGATLTPSVVRIDARGDDHGRRARAPVPRERSAEHRARSSSG